VQRQWIESSVIAAVGYDPASMTLEVEFRGKAGEETGGVVYRYSNVPYIVVEELMTAGSPGKYFGRHVRNRFRGRRVM
jgi:hypothetical protein